MDDIEELDLILSKAISTFNRVKIETHEGLYFVMIGAFTSMLEQTKSFILLYKANCFSSTQPIARVISELYVDIKNIEKDINYRNYLMYEYYSREAENIKAGSKKKEAKKNRDNFKTEYEKYNNGQPFEELSVAAKFKNVELTKDYRTFYSMLCGNTHSGVHMFLNRMDDGSSSKHPYQDIFKNKANVLEKLTVVYISNYVIDACKVIASGFGEEIHKEIDDFYSSLLCKQ
jgi:hypothetical protein